MIGILGGTFDPVHVGHLRAAIEAQERLGLDHVRLMPAHRPLLRGAPGASAEQRATMVKLALEGNSGLKYEGLELERDTPSYTVDSLAILRRKFSRPLVLLIGSDAFARLPHWHRWEQLLAYSHIAVLQRPGAQPDYQYFPEGWMEEKRVDELKGRCGGVLIVDLPAIDISATGIRKRRFEGRSIEFLVPHAVEKYIVKNKLYQKDTNEIR